MKIAALRILILSAIAMAAIKTAGAEGSYYERFVKVSKEHKGFLWDTSLVQTNNSGPALTNAPLSFSQLTGQGGLAGVRLGMTMSEVVAAWGKPRRLVTHCFIGPRFWYGFGFNYSPEGDLSLFFVEDRVVLIEIYGPRAEHLAFDNGLTGKLSRAECEKLLGAPVLRNPDDHKTFYVGDISYGTSNIRTDIAFNHTSPKESSERACRFAGIAVCLELEAVRKASVSPDAAPHADPPHR